MQEFFELLAFVFVIAGQLIGVIAWRAWDPSPAAQVVSEIPVGAPVSTSSA
jgi:hypothetical protein